MIIFLVFKYSSLASQNQINGKAGKQKKVVFFKETSVSVFRNGKRLLCLLRSQRLEWMVRIFWKQYNLFPLTCRVLHFYFIAVALKHCRFAASTALITHATLSGFLIWSIANNNFDSLLRDKKKSMTKENYQYNCQFWVLFMKLYFNQTKFNLMTLLSTKDLRTTIPESKC